MTTYYRVGLAQDFPDPSDKYYDGECVAIDKAESMHAAYGFNLPIVVRDDRDEPVWVFVLGGQFRRVT